MFFFLCSNYYYMRCYTNGAYTLYQQVFEKLGVSVKETTERKREETRNRQIQSWEKERKNLEDKVQVIKALEKVREKHEEDRRFEWDAEKKNLEGKVQVMKALDKEREDRREWDVKKMKFEDKGKLINALGKEREKHEEDLHKWVWEGERKNLEEKLSSISDSLSEAYEESWQRWEEKVQVTEALEREREKHDADHREWDEEKKNLGEKLSSLSEEFEESRYRCEDTVRVIQVLEKKIEKHKEDRRKWDEEKKNLVEKLSSMGDLYRALSEEYLESGRRLDGKVQEIKAILEKEKVKHEDDRHNWEDEKKNLQEKIFVLRDLWRSLSGLYKVCSNKWEEKVNVEIEKHEEDCRKWEEERNQLIDKLGAATASSQRYRELLHDLDKN
ncbi:Golgin subfamily A member 6-like protein [Actinidia chinensis var. chinensis]|uniref:Golgin subfamily A member 6-like protein n=1 Tax=Actinidia chinensis var. chinensis TaxID=1590841 RepID=A0A2R6RBN2_ACTCC|nr:Golgin subfamily A member 6-like protein [Actinidia chinensis var. chinensis]